MGDEAAAALYRALAEHVLEATTPLAGEYERLVFFDPPEALAAVREWLPGVRLLAQSGGDLGARITDAFARAFARGASRVALAGTDAPGLTRRAVAEALDALDDADVVVAPSGDGGYSLVALAAPQPAIFSGVAWSTPRVLAETRARADAARLRLALAAPLPDVDTLEDVRALRGAAGIPPALATEVARALGER